MSWKREREYGGCEGREVPGFGQKRRKGRMEKWEGDMTRLAIHQC